MSLKVYFLIIFIFAILFGLVDFWSIYRQRHKIMADLNSREFQTKLIHDLINGLPTVKDLKIFEETIPAIRDVDISGSYGSLDEITCELSFIYEFNGEQIPLHILFIGPLHFTVRSVPRSGNGFNSPAEGGGYEVTSMDYSGIEVKISTPEGNELNVEWLNSNDNLANSLCKKVLDQHLSELTFDL